LDTNDSNDTNDSKASTLVDGEIEDLRRSLAMLPPGSAGRSREDALAICFELQESVTRLRRLRDRLAAVLANED
jgi:hypothetical protein